MSANPSPALQTGDKFKAISAGAGDLDPRPRAIYIGVSGTMDIRNADNTTETGIPVVAGSVIPCQFNAITALSSATVYGIY